MGSCQLKIGKCAMGVDELKFEASMSHIGVEHKNDLRHEQRSSQGAEGAGHIYGEDRSRDGLFSLVFKEKDFLFIFVWDCDFDLFIFWSASLVSHSFGRKQVVLHFCGAFAALLAKIPCRPIVIYRGCIIVAQSTLFSTACLVLLLLGFWTAFHGRGSGLKSVDYESKGYTYISFVRLSHIKALVVPVFVFFPLRLR